MRVLNDALGKLHQPGKIVLGYDDEQSLYLIGHGGQGTLSIKRVDEGTEELQEFINSKINERCFIKEQPEKSIYAHELGKNITLFKYSV
jgi:hypothetical protein